jgi:hypothetical protein
VSSPKGSCCCICQCICRVSHPSRFCEGWGIRVTREPHSSIQPRKLECVRNRRVSFFVCHPVGICFCIWLCLPFS